jgi:hypothetical protein
MTVRIPSWHLCSKTVLSHEQNPQCPIFWPLPGSEVCPTQGCTLFENITLRNINIFHPLISPGVIWGNSTNPMKNITIEKLNVDENKYKIWHGKWPFHSKRYPFHGRIKCKDASGTCKDSNRSPACLDPAPESDPIEFKVSR